MVVAPSLDRQQNYTDILCASDVNVLTMKGPIQGLSAGGKLNFSVEKSPDTRASS